MIIICRKQVFYIIQLLTERKVLFQANFQLSAFSSYREVNIYIHLSPLCSWWVCTLNYHSTISIPGVSFARQKELQWVVLVSREELN